MARNAVASVLVLDVGSGMCASPSFRVAKEAVSHLSQQKLLFAPKDDVGVVLCGSKATCNSCVVSGDYQHISVIREVLPCSVDLLQAVLQVNNEVGGCAGDLLDALVVAIDLLVDKYIGKAKKKHVFVITDAADPIRSARDVDVIVQSQL